MPESLPDFGADNRQPEGRPPSIRCQRLGKVALISYDRAARRNAWSVSCVRETIAAIRQANADSSVGAIVLTGEGTTYCAGADLKDEPEYDPVTKRRLNPGVLTMGSGDGNWVSLLSGSKPLIAAINGPAIGIGATHTLAADVRLAAQSASFSFPFLRLGAMPECGSTALLPRLVGYGRALNILLRSATLSADEALNIGLVSEVIPDAQLRDAALSLAEKIAGLPPLQVKLTKRMLANNAGTADPDSIMRTESEAFIELLRTLKQEKPL
jgi:2-(1,2-epoxy-1,2-dihydrophenyl)acetyl-CoA isomerase